MSGVIVKAILPGKFNEQAMLQVLRSENQKYAPFIVKDFEKTTAGWKITKPKFSSRITVNASFMRIDIVKTGSNVDIWNYVDGGTKPHMIYPKRARMLRFQAGHSAGSKPGSINTYNSAKSGPVVFSKGVHHPGTVARNFTSVIRQLHEKPYRNWMNTAMRHAARASGHLYK